MDPLLSPEEIEAYHRDGVLVVRGVLTDEEVEVAREAIEVVLASGGILTQVASGIRCRSRGVSSSGTGATTDRGRCRAPSSTAAKWFPEGTLEELPDIDADPDAYDIRAADLRPGDAIFFDFLTIHGAPGFPFAGRRRVLSLRCLAGDATHAPRDWVTSPPFDELRRIIPDGAPMDDPLFPVVG